MPLIDMSECYQMTNVGDHIDGTDVYQTNPNLLDNPFFTINQRGFTSGSSVGYTVDRWKNNTSGKTVTLSSGVLTIPADDVFLQPIDPDLYAASVGKTVTLSVLYSDGTIESGTITVPSSGSTYATGTPRLAMNGTNKQFFCYPPTSISVKAFKLELGSVSTLANDPTPDYGTELLKCMRYFVRLNYTSVAEPIGYGYAYAASQARILIPTPVPMRAAPTISIDATANLRINCNGTYLTPSGFTATGTAFPNGIAVHFGVSGATSGALALLFSYDTLHIDFSADL